MYTKTKLFLRECWCKHGPPMLVALAGLLVSLGVGMLDAKRQPPEVVRAPQVGMQRRVRPVRRLPRARMSPPDARRIALEQPARQTESSHSNSSTHAAAPEQISSSPLIEDQFPPFLHAQMPVSRTQNWGAMHTPEEWNRSFSEMSLADFVPIPRYDLAVLTTPLLDLMRNREANVDALTAKLFYSARYLSQYDLDSSEGDGIHAGVDLKLAPGTPIGAIAGGRVVRVDSGPELGQYVMIEHRPDAGERLYSIYGHLASTSVVVGQPVQPGTIIGTVGMTGMTTAPHVHVQIDRDVGVTPHLPFIPREGTSQAEERARTVNPMTFIEEHGARE